MLNDFGDPIHLNALIRYPIGNLADSCGRRLRKLDLHKRLPMSPESAPKNRLQRRTLTIVLMLNVGLVAALTWAGLKGDSSGLIANAVDNASDAVVYGLSLMAISRSATWKVRAAMTSGVLLLVLAAGVLLDALRRFLYGSEPIGLLMLVMAGAAAITNLTCLVLLNRLGKGDVNLRAVQTFSLNDLISNGGIIVAGLLVMWTHQQWPDLVVGLGVAMVGAKGGLEILADARRTKSAAGKR